MTWAWGPFLALDLETTSVDPETARIVQFGTCRIDGPTKNVTNRFVNPGVPIPAEASGVHGITDEMVSENGMSTRDALAEIMYQIEGAYHDGEPLVIFNAPYDLTVLDRELRRHGLPEVNFLPPVIDPLVLVNRMAWKRPHNLEHACEVWNVPNGGHDAGADALATARLLWRLTQDMRVQIKPGDHDGYQGARALPVGDLRDVPLGVLQRAQARWYRESAEGFIANQREKGRDPGPVNTQWPIIRKVQP